MLKRTPSPNYDPSNYVTERVWATGDGTRIPVSLVYRNGFKRGGTAAMLQYGYGSRRSSSDPYWSPTVPSLLDRGMVYAIAHIRGGQEMGRAWYDQGHLLNKKNSFTDFVDVTRFLVANGYAAKDRVAAMGRARSRLLMGAVANAGAARLSRDRQPGAVRRRGDDDARSDDPLTTNEYDEWGNPGSRNIATTCVYSPDNLSAQDYPAMFVGTGLWDSQVQYFEPAKYVAEASRSQDRPIRCCSERSWKRGTASRRRFRRFKSIAEYYAFMLDQLGDKNDHRHWPFAWR